LKPLNYHRSDQQEPDILFVPVMLDSSRCTLKLDPEDGEPTVLMESLRLDAKSTSAKRYHLYSLIQYDFLM
jgi:hypothetical protein